MDNDNLRQSPSASGPGEEQGERSAQPLIPEPAPPLWGGSKKLAGEAGASGEGASDKEGKDAAPESAGGAPDTTTVTLRLQITKADREPEQPGAADYGVRETLGDWSQALTTSIQQLAEQVTEALDKAIKDVTTLQVSTYVSETLNDISYEDSAGQDPFAGAKLRAVTRIGLDGDTRVIIPDARQDSDRAVWAMHQEMVERAQSNRTEMIRMAVEALGSLFDVLNKS